jgi:osmotically-inducible protein OsmY
MVAMTRLLAAVAASTMNGGTTMRTDHELRTDVVAELNWDTAIRNEDIATSVKDGVVTLAGVVDTYAQRYAAERAAERVKGVRAIANELTVKLPGAFERSDSEIAHAALNALRWHTQVRDDGIRVTVRNGQVTLEGQVDRYYEKQAAENSVRYLTGVKGVTNLITLRPVVAPADVKDAIRTSFRRLADLDAGQIKVEASGTEVTLTGSVRSIVERRDAERAAWNALGVTKVHNQILVSPLIAAGV